MEENDFGHALVPEIAMNELGDVIVVWLQREGTHNQIHSRRFQGGVWQEIEPVESIIDHATEAKVTLNSTGTAVVVWKQKENSILSIWVRQFNPVQGWSSARTIENSAVSAFEPSIALNDNGDIVVAWLQADSDNGNFSDNVWANYRLNGTWSEAVELESDKVNDAGEFGPPQAAINNNGKGVVVWNIDDGNTQTDIYANQISLGNSWSEPILLADNSQYSRYPKVAIDLNDNVLVVWQETTSSFVSIFACRFRASTGVWGLPNMINNGNDDSFNPVIKTDLNGKAITGWIQNESVFVSIFN